MMLLTTKWTMPTPAMRDMGAYNRRDLDEDSKREGESRG
jgi:hypothetical protein